MRPDGPEVVQVDRRDCNACRQRVRLLANDAAPRVHNERMAVALTLVVVRARLRSRDHVALALDGACPQQQLPVRLAWSRESQMVGNDSASP